MRIRGLPRSNEPWVSGHVRILADQAECTVLRILPEVVTETEAAFLYRPIVPGRRRWASGHGGGRKTPTDRASVGVGLHIPGDVHQAVIAEERVVMLRKFKAIDRGPRMHQRRAAVSSYDQIWSLTEDVAATAVAPVVMGEHTQAIGYPEVQIHEPCTARCRVVGCRCLVVQLKESRDSANFEVEPLGGIEDNLGNYIRSAVWRT